MELIEINDEPHPEIFFFEYEGCVGAFRASIIALKTLTKKFS